MFFSDPNEGETSLSVPGLTTWPTYDTVGQRHIRFQGNVTSLPVESHFAANRMHFWNSFKFWKAVGHVRIVNKCITMLLAVELFPAVSVMGHIFLIFSWQS